MTYLATFMGYGVTRDPEFSEQLAWYFTYSPDPERVHIGDVPYLVSKKLRELVALAERGESSDG